MMFTCNDLKIVLCIIALCVSVNAIKLEEELNITQDQKRAIEKLRNMVLPYITDEPYMKDDLHLLHWLQNTQFTLDEAKRGIIEDIKWRKEKDIANILSEDLTDVLDDFPYIYTLDKQGQPSYIAFAGEWDLRNTIVLGKGPRLIRFMTRINEEARVTVRDLQLQGKNVTRANAIFFLEGFNMVQHVCPQCLARILEYLFITDNHYPGIQDRIIFLSAPPAVAATLDLVRNAASPEMRKAMKVYGTDRGVWLKGLHSFISPENLSYEFGGHKPRELFPDPLNSKSS